MDTNTTSPRRISVSDVIFASVMACGRTVYRATYAGMTSIEDIISAIRNSGARDLTSGPVTLSLRNSSQGWTMNRQLMRRRSAAAPEARQLTLW